MIVKVQLSLASSDNVRAALIYDRSRKVELQCEVTEGILDRMRGENKLFFYSHIEGQLIVLDDESPWQEW